MKNICLSVLILMVMALNGCGSDNSSPPPLFVSRILADATLDGDISRVAGSGALAVTQGNTQSVFAGFDPADGAELRAFLHFPLTNVGGVGGVPGNAVIASATLDLFINSIQPNPLGVTIPIRIDLVDLQPPTLFVNDFSRTDQPALATITISPPIAQADFGQHVVVDVTALMKEAQRLGLPRFQVRILRDPGIAPPGLIEINDTTGVNRSTLAPLLEVSYF